MGGRFLKVVGAGKGSFSGGMVVGGGPSKKDPDQIRTFYRMFPDQVSSTMSIGEVVEGGAVGGVEGE